MIEDFEPNSIRSSYCRRVTRIRTSHLNTLLQQPTINKVTKVGITFGAFHFQTVITSAMMGLSMRFRESGSSQRHAVAVTARAKYK